MVVAERIDREAIHRAVDELPTESLIELANFISYLHYKEEHDMDWFYHLQELYAPVRDVADEMSDEEVNQTIADAVKAVRRERKT